MRRIILIILLITGFKAYCQIDTIEPYVFRFKEDTIARLFRQMYASKKDEDKLQINEKIIDLFNKTLVNTETFDYAYDSLTSMGKIRSSDNLLRIYSWNVPLEKGLNNCYAFIQVKPKKADECKVFELKENSDKIENLENRTLKQSEWYGSLIYEIIPVKYKGKKLYTLLSLDFNDLYTNKKYIDILYFSKDYQEIFFGKNIFQTKKGAKSRIVFEYSSRVVMSLKYDTESKQIIFDHLSPTKSSLKGVYQFYGPDFSFDAFKYNKEKWVYIEDLYMKNQ